MAKDEEKPKQEHPTHTEVRQDLERQYGLKEHWKCLAACTLVSMCPFQYGVDFGLIGGLQAMVGFLEIFGHRADTPIGWNIDPGPQQLISSLMILGAFISSGFAGPIAALISRRLTIWLACLLCFISNIIMMTTTNLGGLYAGRFLIGLANGAFMTFSQLYIQECIPARYRGLLISVFSVWTSIGSLVGTIVDNYTSPINGKNSYLIPLGLIYIIPSLMSVGMIFIPESPRWLLQHGQSEKARKALRWLRPYDDTQIEEELSDMQAALEAESELSKGLSIWDMFANPIDRRRTILAVLGLTVQGASGAMYMISYGTYFFSMAGVGNAFANSCILNGVGVAAILINSAVITYIGRRRVFLVTGLTFCGLAQLLTAIVYDAHPGTPSTGRAIVGLAVVYIVAYNGMIATYAWISGGELPSQRLRSYTFGIATATGFFVAWLTTFTAPYFINPESLNWGPKYGYIWTPSCWISALWVYFFLPEVKGRTFEEIDEMFEARLPAKAFRSYVCVGREKAHDSDDKVEKSGEIVHTEAIAPAE